MFCYKINFLTNQWFKRQNVRRQENSNFEYEKPNFEFEFFLQKFEFSNSEFFGLETLGIASSR